MDFRATSRKARRGGVGQLIHLESVSNAFVGSSDVQKLAPGICTSWANKPSLNWNAAESCQVWRLSCGSLYKVDREPHPAMKHPDLSRFSSLGYRSRANAGSWLLQNAWCSVLAWSEKILQKQHSSAQAWCCLHTVSVQMHDGLLEAQPGQSSSKPGVLVTPSAA